MLAYMMRIKEQEEIRDKSNPAASKKPSLNAILKEIPKFKNHGTTNTQRQRNSLKQNIKQFSLLVLIIKKSTRLNSNMKSNTSEIKSKRTTDAKSGIPMDLQATSVKKISEPVYANPVITVLRSNAIM